MSVSRRRKAGMTRRVLTLYNRILERSPTVQSYAWPLMLPLDRAVQSAAAGFAREWGGRRGVDLKKLEGIVVRGPDAGVMVQFAREVLGANVRRIGRAVVQTGDLSAIRAMARIPGVDRVALENAAIVIEVLTA